MTELPASAHLLRTLAAVPPSARVLDLGCGHGRHAEPLARLGFDLWACDASAEAVETTRRRLSLVLGEAEAAQRVVQARPAALAYPDDHFDWVVAYGSLTPDDTLPWALAEALRVLRPGGWLFAAFCLEDDPERLRPEALPALLAEAGFALAEDPALDPDEPRPVVRGIFRKVDRHTVR